MPISQTGRKNAAILSVVLMTALALGGCQRFSYGRSDALPSQPQEPQPLTPSPVPSVQGSQLPPPSNSPQTGPQTGVDQTMQAPSSETASGFPAAPGQQPDAADQGQEMASLGTETGGEPVSREGLIGRWTVEAGGSSCDVFLALTKWTGGYRAASRGCAGTASDISAWDVKGKQVVLSDSTGNRVASLYKSAEERYDGSTETGQSISLSR